MGARQKPQITLSMGAPIQDSLLQLGVDGQDLWVADKGEGHDGDGVRRLCERGAAEHQDPSWQVPSAPGPPGFMGCTGWGHTQNPRAAS